MTWTWTPEHALRQRNLRHTLWCRVTCTSWLKCFWVSLVIHVHVRFSLIFDILPFYFDLSFPVLFFSFHFLHHELQTELDNQIAMEILCRSANRESNDAYDVTPSLTGYEPNYMALSELHDSSGSYSYITPSSDQDMNDVTLGKLLIEGHREHADYRESGRCVCQSVVIVCCVR